MNWRIDSLEIENFKFFKEPFIFNPQCKNILLYGENGSGKSSIYWSLFTIIQSVLKEPTLADARKYFDAANTQHLRNRYSNVGEHSKLLMVFRDTDSNASKDCEDSLTIANATSPALKDFMQKAFMASDFINYKFLSSLFEKRNSVDNEVFEIFNREIFPILSVIGGVTDLDGNFMDSISFKEWWDYLLSVPSTLERNKKNRSSYKQKHPRYIAFQDLINKFNQAVKTTLQEIEIKTNRTLHDVYGLQIDVVLDYKACQFNLRTAPRHYDGIIHHPQIILKAKLTSNKIPEINKEILHPRSFFNEAKLTCMGIALRFAISDTKTNWPDSIKMLVLDDILVSLDMGNRIKVVDEILKHSNRFQTFIFTHDRAFFHLVSTEIKKKGTIADWKIFNLYEDPLTTTPYPKPILMVQDLSDSFAEAKRHYCNCDFAACLNSLRRYSERKLIEILPKHLSLEFATSGETRHKMLGGLITAFSDFCCRFAMTNPCPNLEHYKDRLLNPFSHDNISSPIYRTEVKNLMNELAILDSVEKGIIDNIEKFSSHGYKLYHTSIPGISIEFDMLENFEWVKFNGCYYYSNSLVRITKATGIAINGEMLLYDLFQQIINGVPHPPSLAESIEIKPWHKTLNSISWH